MSLDDFKKKLGGAAGIAGEKAKSIREIVADKAIDAGGLVAKKAVAGKELAAKAGAEARVRYYNPRFREDFFAPDFDLPDIIVVVDGDERKGIDVCEGAIGWVSKHRGIEVMHLYSEFVQESGLEFYPQSRYGAVYQVDPYDSQRFVDLSRIFEIAHKDRITELRNIAFDLGAKYCKLESYESRKEISVKKARGALKGKTKIEADCEVKNIEGSAALEGERHDDQFQEVSVIFEHTFSGSDSPHFPTLHWYKADREIQSLIKMRCSSGAGNRIGLYSVALDGSSSTTMSRSHAAKVDTVLKDLKATCNFTLESESMAEARKKLRFTIEF